MLEVKDLYAGYGSREILSGVSFRVEPHQMVGILGANGSGKSTLLKAICGIIPSRGEITLCGLDAKKLSPRALAQVSRYIPQRSGISMDISCLDVVLMGFNPKLGLLEYPKSSMRKRALEALESVGLSHRANANFQVLSEGQKQLCILARAMLLEEGMLFLDEPESALDFSGRYRMLGMVRQWLKKSRSSALVTLHDPQLALNTCDVLLLLRDGKMIGSIRPSVDSAEDMEARLAGIYGDLSIHRCLTRNRQSQFVLLREE